MGFLKNLTTGLIWLVTGGGGRERLGGWSREAGKEEAEATSEAESRAKKEVQMQCGEMVREPREPAGAGPRGRRISLVFCVQLFQIALRTISDSCAAISVSVSLNLSIIRYL